MRSHVVITGASAGVGRAAAVAFARRGWRVTLLARGEAGLEGARADVEAAGGRACCVAADVADAAAVEHAAQTAEACHGPIDVWVNSAMATVFGPVSCLTADEIRRVTEVTYLGQVHGTMAALRRMRPADRGTIVNVGSALAYHGLPLQSAYCAAKAAVRGFTESLHSELIHDGSRVHLSFVVLPAVDTPQFDWSRSELSRRPRPVAPVYDPQVAARAIVQAARHAPRELLVGGSSLKLVAGSAVAPGWLDHFLAGIGWRGQMTAEHAPPRPGNLFEPLDDDTDHGARGRFGSEARSAALMVPASTARLALAGLAAIPLVAGLLVLASRLRRR